MEAKLYGQNKGGTSINGVIKDYYAYAGENISAGDLVEYINGVASEKDYGTSTDTVINSSTRNSGEEISAVVLDENRVFIAHSHGTSYYLYGVVVTINGATFTVGTDTQLCAEENTGLVISTVLLPNGNVFIAHSGGAGNSYYLRGIIVAINGTTIVAGTDTSLVSTTNAARCISAVLLPNGNVFIAHSYGSYYYLYGIVCTISGTTITKGTDTAINSSDKYTGETISAVTVENGNVFIAYGSSDSYYFRSIICTISGTTISKGSENKTLGAYTAHRLSAVALDNNRIFIAHSYGESDYYLYGIICTISGTSITAGADTLIDNSTTYTGSVISAVALKNGNVFIAHSYTSNFYLYGIVCNVSGTSITPNNNIELSNSSKTGLSISSVLLKNGSIFVAHSYDTNKYLYAQLFSIDYENNIPTNQIIASEYETQVRKTTGQFDGVAKTSGTGGDDTGHNDLVSIWTLVPIVTQEMTMADGNTLADANGDIILVRGE